MSRNPVCRHANADVEYWVWEPGDMTHYEFILVGARNAATRGPVPPTLVLRLGRNSGMMELPTFWEASEIHPGYIGEKMRIGEYEADIVSRFLVAICAPHAGLEGVA